MYAKVTSSSVLLKMFFWRAGAGFEASCVNGWKQCESQRNANRGQPKCRMKLCRVHSLTLTHTCPAQAWEAEVAQQDRNLLETETSTLDGVNARIDIHA